MYIVSNSTNDVNDNHSPVEAAMGQSGRLPLVRERGPAGAANGVITGSLVLALPLDIAGVMVPERAGARAFEKAVGRTIVALGAAVVVTNGPLEATGGEDGAPDPEAFLNVATRKGLLMTASGIENSLLRVSPVDHDLKI